MGYIGLSLRPIETLPMLTIPIGPGTAITGAHTLHTVSTGGLPPISSPIPEF